MENIFEKGCLVQLSIGVWRAAKKIDKSRLAEMSSSHEWLTATKKLVDPEALKPIAKIGNAARTYLNSISLPFPLNGMVFVPKDIIGRVDERLTEFQAEFNQAVSGFTNEYDYLRGEAMNHLGDLFNGRRFYEVLYAIQNIYRMITHSFEIIVHFDCADKKPEISAHGLVSGNQLNAHILDHDLKFIDLVVEITDLIGHLQILILQSIQ